MGMASGSPGDIGGCPGREHQAMQGRREHSGWSARVRLRTRQRAACSRAGRRRILPGGPLGVNSLEDLDRITRAELDDRFLPARLLSALEAAALRLRLDLGDVDAQHLHAEELLDRLADLGLVRVRVNAERVGIGGLDLRVALLGHDWSKQDLVGVQAHDALSCTRSSASWVTSTERAHTSAATSS